MGKIILVSACLAGKPCRYDGGAKRSGVAMTCPEDGRIVPACPEGMAGLPIPRPPAEIRGGDGFDVLKGDAKVYNKEGKEVTEEFLRGARKFLAYAQKIGADEVRLKAKSPSCGVACIYDGTFDGRLREGCGVTCALLLQNGIKVVEIP